MDAPDERSAEDAAVWEWDNWPADTLVLIACGAKKRQEPSTVERLYTGSLFSAALSAARALNEDRYIRVLSARHGFVALTDEYAPYDITWADQRAISRERLARQAGLLEKTLDFSCVVSLMPAEYTRRARAALDDSPARPFVDAMEGVRGIGDMRHRLHLITQLVDDTPRTDSRPSPVLSSVTRPDTPAMTTTPRGAGRATQPALWDTITVHCFACDHTVEDPSPQQAHDAMEAHYRSVHAELIARMIGGVEPRPSNRHDPRSRRRNAPGEQVTADPSLDHLADQAGLHLDL
jgi:hypothetical protein